MSWYPPLAESGNESASELSAATAQPRAGPRKSVRFDENAEHTFYPQETNYRYAEEGEGETHTDSDSEQHTQSEREREKQREGEKERGRDGDRERESKKESYRATLMRLTSRENVFSFFKKKAPSSAAPAAQETTSSRTEKESASNNAAPRRPPRRKDKEKEREREADQEAKKKLLVPVRISENNNNHTYSSNNNNNNNSNIHSGTESSSSGTEDDKRTHPHTHTHTHATPAVPVRAGAVPYTLAQTVSRTAPVTFTTQPLPHTQSHTHVPTHTQMPVQTLPVSQTQTLVQSSVAPHVSDNASSSASVSGSLSVSVSVPQSVSQSVPLSVSSSSQTFSTDSPLSVHSYSSSTLTPQPLSPLHTMTHTQLHSHAHTNRAVPEPVSLSAPVPAPLPAPLPVREERSSSFTGSNNVSFMEREQPTGMTEKRESFSLPQTPSQQQTLSKSQSKEIEVESELENEQLRLVVYLSQQEARHGVNMLQVLSEDELRRIKTVSEREGADYLQVAQRVFEIKLGVSSAPAPVYAPSVSRSMSGDAHPHSQTQSSEPRMKSSFVRPSALPHINPTLSHSFSQHATPTQSPRHLHMSHSACTSTESLDFDALPQTRKHVHTHVHPQLYSPVSQQQQQQQQQFWQQPVPQTLVSPSHSYSQAHAPTHMYSQQTMAAPPPPPPNSHVQRMVQHFMQPRPSQHTPQQTQQAHTPHTHTHGPPLRTQSLPAQQWPVSVPVQQVVMVKGAAPQLVYSQPLTQNFSHAHGHSQQQIRPLPRVYSDSRMIPTNLHHTSHVSHPQTFQGHVATVMPFSAQR